MKYKPMCGEHVLDVAKKICELAREKGEAVTANFNGHDLLATNGDTLDDVLDAYCKETGAVKKDLLDPHHGLYPDTAQEWLDKWDSGQSVFTIEMGGIGPGYEQCIHITCAELIRHMLTEKYDSSRWSDQAQWDIDREAIRASSFKNEKIMGLGLSGAQFGAAMQLATHFYMHGPRSLLEKKDMKDRTIQVSSNWPGR